MRKLFFKLSLLVLFLQLNLTVVQAQTFAVKTNLLYDVTGTINLGVEVGLSRRLSLDLSGSLNPWMYNTKTNTKLKHVLVQPELRYWLCERFAGHFLGVHAHWSEFNVGALNLPLGITENSLAKYRYQGTLYGAGINYGYQWVFKHRWAVEADLGVGYAYIDYKKYQCESCGTLLAREKTHYIGPTKAAISLIFFIK